MNETVKEWCMCWQPPPLPPQYHPAFIQMYDHARVDPSYVIYTEKCEGYIEIPEILPTKGVTVVTFAGSKVQNAGLSGWIVFLIVFIVIVIIIVFAFMTWKIWKKKKRTGRYEPVTGNVPLEVYESTNYLDNKATRGQCWKTSNLTTPDNNGIENMYNSLPRSNGMSSCDMEVPDGTVLNGALSSQENKPQNVKRAGVKNGLPQGPNSTERPWSQKFEDIHFIDDPPSPPPAYDQAVEGANTYGALQRDSGGFNSKVLHKGGDIQGLDDKTVDGKMIENQDSGKGSLPPIEVTQKSSPKKKKKAFLKTPRQVKDEKNPRT
ncbi:uncharacterized protein LOC128208133 isoform X1 [Mya arenaria]|uniref:uncharacterized protein LOC128208133 isoform X1 n=1 Tax=Mya arenaria TaxID=6604 RepID=UPI0022E794F7|nr:uncharacterized protein LOC128208133 isoform X1 [Mya arenaria]